ncbi:MAG TPA: hypothetical protein VFT50_09180 [Baekduia sp.]|nr:hypothetical protein [Baekduia sp.]
MKMVIVGGVAARASTGGRLTHVLPLGLPQLHRLLRAQAARLGRRGVLAGAMMAFHGFHRTPLEAGKGGMPVVAHAEDQMAQRAGALAHV